MKAFAEVTSLCGPLRTLCPKKIYCKTPSICNPSWLPFPSTLDVLQRLRVRLMATCQEPRQDLEFQLRTLSHHGGPAVRSVRLLNHFTSTRPLNWCRSSLASDDDYTLFTVIIFRKVFDAFVQKCRENKYEKICLPVHTLLALLTHFAKIRRKRLSVFIRPNRQGARGAANRRYCRKGALGEFPAQRPLVGNSLINYRRSCFGFQRSTFQRLSKLSCTSR